MPDRTARFPNIARYLDVQQAYSPSWVGDGRHIVFLSNLTGVPQVWETQWEAGQSIAAWPDQRTFEAERVMGVWCSPAPGDARLIFARDSGGDENAQLFLLDDRSEERPLTADWQTAMHVFGAWSADGSAILFSANRRDPARFDLLLQPLDGEARIVWQNDAPGYLRHATFAPDGSRVAVVRSTSSFEHELFEVDLATATARRVGPAGVRYEALDYAAGGDSLYVVTDAESDFLYLARLDLAAGVLEPLVAAPWDIAHMSVSPDGRTLAYTVNEDGVSRLRVYDVASGDGRDVPAFDSSPGVVAWLDSAWSWSLDSRRLAFSYTSATRTSDIWVWDIEANTVVAVTRSSHGGVSTASFVAPELIRYPSFDDRMIPAWFFRPTQSPAPAVVVVHGGPESQFVPYFHFLVQYLVASGYAVLATNVRGSTGYGKAYSHLDDVERRMDSVEDLAYAARWLQREPSVDGERLAVYGGSYGGFMVLATLVTHPQLWAAGVDVVGISNFVTFLERTSAYRRAHREAEYGSLERDRAFLERISPINQIENIVAPTLVIHGANDPRVPLNEAQQLVAALDRRGVPTRLMVFDDEGHGLVKLKNKLVAYPAVVDFLRQHLGEGEMPSE
jgi:dipeptidyl aminopeptidase/acylaminoacyl peptidase